MSAGQPPCNPPQPQDSLLARLRERGVLRVAASYAVIAWPLLQIASVVFDSLGVLLVTVVVLAVRQSDIGKPMPPASPAIAVLPFENLSADPRLEYCFDGLADEGSRNISRSES